MPRQTHTVGRRLRESQTLILVADLLKRGARTKTVERLTGLTEVPIRDVYREIFGSSPQKGPSGYSHTYFTSSQVIQFHSTLAQVCIDTQYKARSPNSTEPQAPELGTLYCKAYDMYLANLKPLSNLIEEPMCFERFSHLLFIFAKKSVLAHRSCSRCEIPFIIDTSHPEYSRQRLCPSCRIHTTRTCAKCDTYVPLDSLDVSPKRRPMCNDHASKHRPKTFSKLISSDQDSQTLDELDRLDANPSQGAYLIDLIAA